MEIEVEQLQQARALASVQQTAKQMAAELDQAWASQKRETELAQERQDQVDRRLVRMHGCGTGRRRLGCGK